MAKDKAARPPKKAQEPLPEMGTEKRDAEIIDAAKRYATDRDARQEAGREEKIAKDNLLEIMTRKGKVSYVFGDIKVFVDSKKSLKVRVQGENDEDEGEDD